MTNEKNGEWTNNDKSKIMMLRYILQEKVKIND